MYPATTAMSAIKMNAPGPVFGSSDGVDVGVVGVGVGGVGVGGVGVGGVGGMVVVKVIGLLHIGPTMVLVTPLTIIVRVALTV